MITNFILIMVVLKFTSSVPQQVGLPVLPTSSRLPFQFTDIDDLPRRRFPVSFRSPTSQVGSFDPRLPTSPQEPYLQPHLVGPSGIVLSDGTIVQTYQPLSNNQHPAPQLIAAVTSTPTRTTTTTAATGCNFGNTIYADGDYLVECLELRCCNGAWTSVRKAPRSVCGRCLAYGDPHIIPYDNLHNLKYETTQTGDFALTQPGFTNPASFGVNSKFVSCAADGAKSCIRSITYYELGIAVKLTLPPPEVNIDWCAESAAHANSAACAITVDVGVDRIPTPGYEAVALKATSGTVLVFKRDHVDDANNLYCIAIVGSKGFSMALCQHYKNWPYFYVYAMPSLSRPTESHLYGLCNVYTTGSTPTDYTERYGKSTSDIRTFIFSWKVTSSN